MSSVVCLLGVAQLHVHSPHSLAAPHAARPENAAHCHHSPHALRLTTE